MCKPSVCEEHRGHGWKMQSRKQGKQGKEKSMNFITENSTIMVDVILGGIFLIEGLVQLFAGKMPNYSNMVKTYTPESVERFIKPSGVVSILFGLCILGFGFSMDGGPLPPVMKWISGAAIVVCVIIYLLMVKKYLVKK